MLLTWVNTIKSLHNLRFTSVINLHISARVAWYKQISVILANINPICSRYERVSVIIHWFIDKRREQILIKLAIEITTIWENLKLEIKGNELWLSHSSWTGSSKTRAFFSISRIFKWISSYLTNNSGSPILVLHLQQENSSNRMNIYEEY
jgi:hypothetical protein